MQIIDKKLIIVQTNKQMKKKDLKMMLKSQFYDTYYRIDVSFSLLMHVHHFYINSIISKTSQRIRKL